MKDGHWSSGCGERMTYSTFPLGPWDNVKTGDGVIATLGWQHECVCGWTGTKLSSSYSLAIIGEVKEGQLLWAVAVVEGERGMGIFRRLFVPLAAYRRSLLSTNTREDI